MPQFTIQATDPIWPVILGKHRDITSGVEKPRIPNNEMTITFDVVAVGNAGATLKIEKGRDRVQVQFPVSQGSAGFEAAQEFATNHGGQKDLGRVLIRIRGIKLNNLVEADA